MTLVAAKKRCSGMRKVPLKKKSPTATAAAIPTIVPIHVCSPSLESSTARRISASSAPSRRTIRKTNRNMPQPGALGISLHFLLDFFFQVARNAVHPYDHRNNEDRRDQEHQPLEAVFADAPALQGHGHSQAERSSGCHTVPDETCQASAARSGKIDEDNADDERSFNAFTKCD